MKKIEIILIAALAAFASACNPEASTLQQPIKIILETDMGNDIDDAIALAYAMKAMDENKIELLAVGCHKNCPTAAAFVDVVTTYYGHPEVRVAMSNTPVQEFSNYVDYTATGCAMGLPRSKSDEQIEEPVRLYRQLLAEAEDHSICFVSIGFGTTIAQLLESPADDISPLDGVALVGRKASMLSIMAGSYGEKKRDEYNVVNDIPAMQKVFDLWPVEIVQNPFEIGKQVMYPGSVMAENLGFETPNPVAVAYAAYSKMPYDRPSWDVLSFEYLTDPELFTKSVPGKITVDDKGYTHFEACEKGQHYVLSATIDQPQALKSKQLEMTVKGYDRLSETAPGLYAGKEKKRLVCLDLDATITQHRTAITEENYAALERLAKKYKLVMVCAGNAPRVFEQMNHFPVTILGNYGMQEAIVADGKLEIIREDTVPADTAFFVEKTNYLREKYGYTDYSGESVEFHKSGMVTFGLLGKDADNADKLVFDPDREKRRAMYPEVLEIFKDYSVFIGGSSSFDIAGKQYNKYDAVMKYAAENGYIKDQVIFVGDDFGDGGGDSHVRLGGLDYISIDDYRNFPVLTAVLL